MLIPVRFSSFDYFKLPIYYIKFLNFAKWFCANADEIFKNIL